MEATLVKTPAPRGSKRLVALVLLSACLGLSSAYLPLLPHQLSSTGRIAPAVGSTAPRNPVFSHSRLIGALKGRRLQKLWQPLHSTSGQEVSGATSAPGLKSEGFKLELRRFSKFLQSSAWFSWWCQVILNTIAAVILFFANVYQSPAARKGLLANGLVFAISSLILGGISIFWTWGYTGVSRRLKRNMLEPSSSLSMISRVVRTSVLVNLLGLSAGIIGAEQFVGTLVAKVLSQQGLAPLVVNPNAYNADAFTNPTLQPLDIFVIQANTNTLLSHFISLTVSLILLLRYGRLLKALDPQPDPGSSAKPSVRGASA